MEENVGLTRAFFVLAMTLTVGGFAAAVVIFLRIFKAKPSFYIVVI
jgi:hypothetical protein